MITEDKIDKAISFVSENTELATNDFIADFPAIVSYLFSGKFDLLSAEENELLMFIFLVINETLSKEDYEKFDMEKFQSNEEKNWDLFENNKNLKWEEKINACFEDYKQEDLLALVEDLITEDEDPVLTSIGKEFIFVTTKSFIDCFI